MDGIADLKLDVHTRFVSNGYTVLIYEGSATMIAAAEGVEVPVRSNGVIVLRIEGDRIAEHIDYVDYGAVRRQLAAGARGGDER